MEDLDSNDHNKKKQNHFSSTNETTHNHSRIALTLTQDGMGQLTIQLKEACSLGCLPKNAYNEGGDGILL